jgi:parvulin-like peptidyl-prolyl isomerase
MATRLRLFPTAAVLAGVLVAAAGCGGGGSSGAKSLPPSAVAVVGDKTISAAELKTVLDGVKRRDEARGATFPKEKTTAYRTLRRKALQTLVQETRFEQKAVDLGVKPVTKQDVDAELAKVKQSLFGSKRTQYKYTHELAKEGITEADLRADLYDKVLEDRLYAKVISGITITQQQIQDFYDKNKTQYGHPATRVIRHILVDSKELADSIEEQLKNGASFAALARKYSKDVGSISTGGKVTISEGHTLKQFDEVAFKLKLNEVSKPVATSYGWHIIEAIGPVVQATFTPLAEKEKEIRAQILKLERQSRWSKFLADMRKEFASKTTYRAGYAPKSAAAS